MTRHWRLEALAGLAIAGTLTSGAGCRRAAPPAASGASVARGGELVASVHSDPRSFNRFVARDSTSELVAILTQARLVRINRATQDVEPWLAESWTRSADGRQYTLRLRPGVTFSDGHPFTSDDVVFSFDAVYDEKNGSVLGDSLQVDGKRLHIAAPDPLTVVVTFPVTFAPGVRLLDNLPVLPRHKLGAALKDGVFAAAWGLATPPGELAGLGPFVLTEYVAGQRLVFARNPHYWRLDGHGNRLPYLDRVTVQIIPDQETELLRLETGQLDLTAREIRPEDYTPLKRAADAGRVKVLDLGVAFDADSLWFNLKPDALAHGDPRAAWLQHDTFRRAISMAVDRQLFTNTVFLGAGVPVYGPVTPANTKWFASMPPLPHDPEGARRQLASLGLTAKNADGLLEDAGGQAVRFSLLAQTGTTSIERGAAVIRDELKKIGVAVDVLAFDPNTIIRRVQAGQYEAVLYRLTATDSDPAVNPDFWLSSGSAHVWNAEQKTPASGWEARIDALMRRQVASPDDGERKRLFDEVQRIFAEHLPTIQFVAPRVYVAASARVTNLTPTAMSRPQLLWAPDTIAVVH